MDNELRQYLEAMEARMFAKFATKEDLDRLEVSLLTASRKTASPAELRARTRALVLRAVELSGLES
jgi:hypothetical protein